MRHENDVFRALGDPSRRAIFEHLTKGEAAVRDLVAVFEISQPAISQHLAVLESAELVAKRKEGRLVFYRIKPAGLKPLVDWIATYQEFWLERALRLRKLLEEMDDE